MSTTSEIVTSPGTSQPSPNATSAIFSDKEHPEYVIAIAICVAVLIFLAIFSLYCLVKRKRPTPFVNLEMEEIEDATEDELN